MEQKYRGMLAYIFGWIAGLIILFGFKDNDSKTKFNAYQAITIDIATAIVSTASAIIEFLLLIISPILGFIMLIVLWILPIVVLVFKIIGAVKAYREEDAEMPIISDLTRKMFKNQLD